MRYIIVFLLFIQVLCAQDFDEKKFSNINKYGWDNPEIHLEARENLFSRQKLLQIYQLNKKKPYTNVIKSAIMPGWGHFSAKNYIKGQILLATEIALFGTSLYYYDQASEYYDKYKKATNITDINNYYEKTRSPLRLSREFLSFGILIWIYTIYDTLIVTESYNRELWENLIIEYHDKKLKVTPTGISLRF
ncbi:MAG: hypothetical protein K8S23_15405 [Candidatus Cloacimonetes bacterium]|nr:hypothetical protein [Candidatus Cloacimonadota bacterium]